MLLTEDRFTFDICDPTLAATLELVYLRPLLDALPLAYRTALDVGAHKGDVSAFLCESGFRVVAVEPQQNLADRLAERLAADLRAGRLSVERCGASDRTGVANLFVGRASTVSTLEADWTTVAFPEEFQTCRSVQIPLRTLADVRRDHGLAQLGYAKIDVEGHELSALRGLLHDNAEPPMVVMFEANQRFASSAIDCMAMLREAGYDRFDMLIREGIAPIAATTFDGSGLPDIWNRCDTPNRYFYANVIAYHRTLPSVATPPNPDQFMEVYRVGAAKEVLRQALAHEAEHAIPVQPEWETARAQLRAYLEQTDDWSTFLAHPICRHMFVRGRWGPAQELEHAALQASPFGRQLLVGAADPAVGAPRLSEPLPHLSTNTLGMAWYIHSIHQARGGELPQRVVEIGGGFGALARLYAVQSPAVAYVIFDLPEMLALQHYYLTAALPGMPVHAALDGEISPKPGSITLVPISRLAEVSLETDLAISTFAYSEMPIDLQSAIRLTNWFNASRLFLTGQMAGEAPEASWVDAGAVFAGVMADFRQVNVERYHIGRNYVLRAER